MKKVILTLAFVCAANIVHAEPSQELQHMIREHVQLFVQIPKEDRGGIATETPFALALEEKLTPINMHSFMCLSSKMDIEDLVDLWAKQKSVVQEVLDDYLYPLQKEVEVQRDSFDCEEIRDLEELIGVFEHMIQMIQGLQNMQN